MENTKQCTKCKSYLDKSNFTANKRYEDGLKIHCKECVSAVSRVYREKNKSSLKEYVENNKEKLKHYQAEYREKNKESSLLYAKDYRENNKEKVKNCAKKYYIENKEELSKKQKIFYENNKEKIVEANKRWSKTPMGVESNRNKKHRRRTATKNGDVTTMELLELKQNTKNCYWCNCILNGKIVHIDHYLPLSKGGKHTLSNLVIACQHCNVRKRATDPIRFANSIGRLL